MSISRLKEEIVLSKIGPRPEVTHKSFHQYSMSLGRSLEICNSCNGSRLQVPVQSEYDLENGTGYNKIEKVACTKCRGTGIKCNRMFKDQYYKMVNKQKSSLSKWLRKERALLNRLDNLSLAELRSMV